MIEEGTRVGAILSMEDGVVEYLGDGTYIGDLQPPVLLFGFDREEVINECLAEGSQMEEILSALANPCIKLDSGRYVWGFQCWWGPLDEVKEKFAECTFKDVEIESLEPLDNGKD